MLLLYLLLNVTITTSFINEESEELKPNQNSVCPTQKQISCQGRKRNSRATNLPSSATHLRGVYASQPTLYLTVEYQSFILILGRIQYMTKV